MANRGTDAAAGVTVLAAMIAIVAGPGAAQTAASAGAGRQAAPPPALAKAIDGDVRDLGSFPDEASALAAWRAAALPADIRAIATIAGRSAFILADGTVVRPTVRRAGSVARSGPRVKTPLAPEVATDAMTGNAGTGVASPAAAPR